MQNPEPRSQYLNLVLRQIDQTKLRIPQFQRHFVWGESDIVALLDSIKYGYPIGSILTWKIDSSDEYFSGFRTRPFPPADTSLSSFEVILDGAQRMSTLYGTLKSPGDEPLYRVYYDLRSERFHHITGKAKDGEVGEPWQLPMSSLLDSRRFLEAQGGLAAVDDSEDLIERALQLFSTFQEYQIPLITLPSATLEEVVEVFRRVNSSGTPLSAVDFTRALTWRSNFDLEPTFERITSKFEGTSLDGISEEFLVRCLAISAGLGVDAREIVELKDYSGKNGGLDEEVNLLTEALAKVEEFLAELNVKSLTEVPYEIQRILLFSAFYYYPSVDSQALRGWLWSSTFAEEYQSKPDSFTTRMVKYVRDGQISQAIVVNNALRPELLARRKRRAGSAVTQGFELKVFSSEPLSPVSGEKIYRGESVARKIFESSDLSAVSADRSAASVIANWVYIHRSEMDSWKEVRADIVRYLTFGDEVSEEIVAGLYSQGFASVGRGSGSFSPAEILERRSARMIESEMRFVP